MTSEEVFRFVTNLIHPRNKRFASVVSCDSVWAVYELISDSGGYLGASQMRSRPGTWNRMRESR